jgi:hypothetical protein
MSDSPKRYALNIGCGPDYREEVDGFEWDNIDIGKCEKDYYCDISKVPWRYWSGDMDFSAESSHYDRIDAIQVLEHIPKDVFAEVIREMYRVSKNGAEWNIASPHGFSDNFITDPTHQTPFSTRTFDYFVGGTPLRELGVIYGWDDICLKHVQPPAIDGNQSVIFKLRVIKECQT